MKNLTFRNNFACFSAMFLWAIGFPAVEVLLESWGSLTLVFLRFFITAIILFPDTDYKKPMFGSVSTLDWLQTWRSLEIS